MPVQGRHPSQYAWRPGGPPDTEPDFGRICGVHATGIEPAGAGGEPGALTAHARFWEGPGINWTWIKYCDTTRGNGWTTGKTNRILNPRDPGLLTPSGGSGRNQNGESLGRRRVTPVVRAVTTKPQTGDDPMKSTCIAYVLWALCIVGLCGIHRFYAGKALTGLIWLFTFGLLGFGQLIDLVLIPGMITNANLRFVAFGGARQNVNQNVVVNVVNPGRP